MELSSSVVAVVGGGHHRPADPSRVVDEQLIGGEASEAESERVRLLDAELVEEADHVCGEMLEGHRPIDVGGPDPCSSK